MPLVSRSRRRRTAASTAACESQTLPPRILPPTVGPSCEPQPKARRAWVNRLCEAAPDGKSEQSALRRRTDGEVQWSETVAVAANAAHVYTECARIWNPIHTDDAVARA